MSDAPRKEIPRPKGDDDFEELALELFRSIWQDSGAQLHGRRGQRQHGVDLYGHDRFGGSGLHGVQCKQHGSATPVKDEDLVKELLAEVEKAKGFQPPLQHFLFATTARRSTALQQAARDVTERHRPRGLFEVHALGWEDLEDRLRRHAQVLDWYLDRRDTLREPLVDPSRLPIPGPHLIGREAELARLDAAWEDAGVRVLTFVAFGGAGKSALLSRWLDRMASAGWRGARRVLDWSFYSQGSEDRIASADRFLDYALGWFGDPDPTLGAPRDRGSRLVELVRRERTLLVLDGVEPLQHPANHALAGRLRDPGLAALLKGLAGANPGLCVVTTRERIADLNGFSSTAPQESLEALSPAAGVELLKRLGVKGRASELQAASREFGNHALTLSLLGGYLNRACRGDVRRRGDVSIAGVDERKDGHALRVIGTYARWLGEGPELSALRLLGLFDRPALPQAIQSLRAAPAIPGLTDLLVDLREEDWQSAISSLREHGLLLPAGPRQPETLDAHPLVRAYFQWELKTRRHAAWKAGNLRLYEHLKAEAPDRPGALVQMEPLYAAVVHGCRAEREQEALKEVYRRRIQRGDEHFSTRKLGALGLELSVLASFFDQPWVKLSHRLPSKEQAFVLTTVGHRLRALGRLVEAVQPIEAGLALYVAGQDWKNAASSASSLCELTLALGKAERALAFGRQGVELADRSGNPYQRKARRSTLADVLHQLGRWQESRRTFREAELIEDGMKEGRRRLHGLRGYWHCDLLLSLGEPESGAGPDDLTASPGMRARMEEACREVLGRAEHTLQRATASGFTLAIALDHLCLGRARRGLGEVSMAAEHFERAVEELRRSGYELHLPLGLLARAGLRRLQADWEAARADLAEALEVAEWGAMRLHDCDAHLEWARLHRDCGDRASMAQHLTRARTLVEETGYGRRRREVEYLEGQLR